MSDSSFSANTAAVVRAMGDLEQRLSRQDLPRPRDVELSMPQELPETGWGDEEALSAVGDSFVKSASLLGHPGFFAHMDPPTPWVTWAAYVWVAALNQNMLHPDTSPSAGPLEDIVIRWIAPRFGMNGGHLTPGSTVANLTALWAARELRGVEEVIASSAAHVSIPKAAAILGLRYRPVEVDDRQRMRLEELGDVSRAALVLTAGTVSTGCVDPLNVDVAPAWRHVDAAWAGPLRLSQRHAAVLDGIDRADSVSVSAHKWLFQPKECALVMFRDSALAHEAVSFGGAYLARPNVGVLGSRAATAVPLAATLLAWGRKGVAERLDHCMSLAAELAGLIDAHRELQLWGEPQTGVVVWRPRDGEPVEVQARLARGFVSLTELDGESWFRSVAANPLADPRLVVDEVVAALSGYG